MLYCPKCDAEYRDDVSNCTDDGTPLLKKEQYESANERRGDAESKILHFRLTTVLSLPDQFEAEELAEALLSEGLDVALASNKLPTMGTLTTPGPEMYSIVVPENEAEKARAFLTEWQSGLEASSTEAAIAAEQEEAATEKP